MAAKYYTNGNPLRYLSKSWMFIAEQPKHRLFRLYPYIIIIGLMVAGLWYGFRQVFSDIIFPAQLLTEQGQDWQQSLLTFCALAPRTPVIILAVCFLMGYFGLLIWKIRVTESIAPQDRVANMRKHLVQLWLNDILVGLLILVACGMIFGIHMLLGKVDDIPFWVEPTMVSLLGIFFGLWLLTLHLISQQHILVEATHAPHALWLALTQHADFQKWLLLGFVATLCGLALSVILCFPALILCATDIIVIKAGYLSDNTIIPSYFPIALYITLIVGCAIFLLVQTWIFLAYSICFRQSTRINYKDNNDTRTN